MDFSFVEDNDLRTKLEAAYVQEQETMKEKAESLLNERLEEATTGLKNKVNELLSEKKKLQEKYGDIKDPQAALDALKFLQEDEMARLLKEGKFEEVLERRTATLKSDYEAKLTEMNSNFEAVQERANTYEGMYKTKMVEDALRNAAIKAKVRPEALTDIILRGNTIFSLGDDNKTVEARDSNGKLLMNSDGTTILTPDAWVNDLKVTARHFWPDNESARFNPNNGDMSDLDAAIAAAANKGDSAKYRELRAKRAKLMHG